ncbi:MOSC domain-containing protein [Roseibium porphyridii]|uniref:MOSC domain-containing protein n=1 Tax=Roseibium porphyridii TaxID=2866279 RepID=A0ABY8F4W7_9HYPH|nr:MOSC domain-containing protein [Roseibium sp. KMA01]WFE89809.1 MOSC domain-containing protein [Roseibium sp. KMA01]
MTIHVAKSAGASMQQLSQARCHAGKGIEGDRYFLGRGKFSSFPDAADLTLMASETLSMVQDVHGEIIGEGEHRRNLTTAGVPLQELVGQDFLIGSVLVSGIRLNKPCRYLQMLLKKPVIDLLGDDCGLHCKILRDGTINSGDSIVPRW